MRLNLWTEIRTAGQVARLGSLSRAAKELGMHHSTIIRHVDGLEAALGVKLFQRHAQGYTPTEAGEELLRTASTVDEQFAQMIARIEDAQHEVSGRLVLTAVPGLDYVLLPMIERYLAEHAKVQLTYSSDERHFELARGEAHIALRAGPRPTRPDNVVSHLADMRPALYAARSYADRYGLPSRLDELGEHRFVVGEDSFARAAFNQWLVAHLPDEAFVLRTPQINVASRAIQSGIGIGFMGRHLAGPEMIRLFPDFEPEEWRVPIWMVTHVDLHRSPKVQSLTRFLQAAMKELRD